MKTEVSGENGRRESGQGEARARVLRARRRRRSGVRREEQ